MAKKRERCDGKTTREAILDKLSRLPELSKEELEAISDKVKNLKQ